MIQFLLNFINENFIYLLVALTIAIILSIGSKKFRKIFGISIIIGLLYFTFLTYCKFNNYVMYKVFVKYVYHACIMFQRSMHIIFYNTLQLRNLSSGLLAVGVAISTLLCVYIVIITLKLLLVNMKSDDIDDENDQLISNVIFDLKYDTISKLNTVLRC